MCESKFSEGFDKKYSDIADEMFDWQRIAEENKQKELDNCVKNLKVLLKHRSKVRNYFFIVIRLICINQCCRIVTEGFELVSNKTSECVLLT